MNKFHYSTDGKTVVYVCQSKGETFKGIARCSAEDKTSQEIGERLAQCRADLQIRKRDLTEIRLAKDCVHGTWADMPQTQSKLWMQWYQDACRVEKQQLKHMRNLKNEIKNLENGIILSDREKPLSPKSDITKDVLYLLGFTIDQDIDSIVKHGDYRIFVNFDRANVNAHNKSVFVHIDNDDADTICSIDLKTWEEFISVLKICGKHGLVKEIQALFD